MDDALLVGVLHGLAVMDEQLQPFPGGQLILVAEVGDVDAAHQLHDEIGPARFGGAGIKNARDVGMVHQGQGLPLGLKAGDDLAGVHAGLDDLDGDLAAHRVLLLGYEDQPHTAFADLLH